MKKNQEIIKQNNIKLLLSSLLELRPISRVALAKKIHMSPTSITRITSMLISKGLVVETDIQSQGVGRHAVMLDTVATSAYALGIEIRSKSIKYALTNLHKECTAIYTYHCPTPNRTLDELADIVYREGINFLETNNISYDKITGIGVCVPGVVDNRNNIVELSTQLKWKNQDILAKLEPLFNKPMILENDSKARIIGEKCMHNIPDGVDSALLIIGSGVSAAAMSRGELVRGFRNAAGEIGHISLERDGVICDCNRKGCLQTRLSDKFLINLAKQYDETVAALPDITAAYRDNKEWAVNIIEKFKSTFLLTLDIIESCYNPVVVIVSGSVVEFMAPFLNECARQYTNEKATGVNIIITHSKKNIAAFGAAVIAQQTYITNLIDNIDIYTKSFSA